MNRREFLRRLEVLSAGAAACGGVLSASGCLGFHYVNSSLVGDRLIIRRTDFGENPFVLVDAPGMVLPLYVRRSDDGSFSAVSTRCMHRGCQVEPAADRLVCPCHGSEYTHTGEILKGPTELPLQRFSTSADANAVVIELGRPGDVP